MADVLKEDDENGNDEGIVIVEDKNELSDQDDDNNEDQDDSGDERVQSTSDGDGHDGERESIRERRRLEKLERKIYFLCI